MKSPERPGFLTGLIAGVLLVLPLLAVFFAMWRIFGLPFVPFDLFDWISRVLPGSAITFGIDSLVKIVRGVNAGPTAVAAKAAEQAMAVSGTFVAGIIIVFLFFLVSRLWPGKYAPVAGLLLGAVLGALVLAVSLGERGTATAGPVASGVWIVGIFLIWGVAIGWIYRRLDRAGQEAAPQAEVAAVRRIDRRRFMVEVGGTAAVITVAGGVVGALTRTRPPQQLAQGRLWSDTHPLPNASASIQPAYGTRPEFTLPKDHYRIDINTFAPHVDEKTWRLKITGLVDVPMDMTLDDLRRQPPQHLFVTLACISNPVGGDLISTTRWTGVSLRRLLPQWKLRSNATHLLLRSADGFYEIVPLATIHNDPRVMLCYDWDGQPLSAEHGFPLRIYIPDLYGMKQPKWIVSIEAIDHWEPGYWVVRGWDKTARMKATSVIDVVAMDMMIINAGPSKLIPIGGIAHAGARGISRVELKADDGPWRPAQLRAPLSELTWVIWRYEWPYQPGEHTFTVRCFDGKGVPQIVQPAPPHPSGASGLYSKTMRL